MNIEKHINYWRTGSDEDWEMVEIAMEKGKIRHGLFFLHLAMEKLIKAHVMRKTAELPPRIHNLVRLMACASIPLDQTQENILQVLNKYCMEGRYANDVDPAPTRQRAMEILKLIQEMRTWLISQL